MKLLKQFSYEFKKWSKNLLKFFKTKEGLFLILITALGAFLRFWKLSEYLYFNIDETRDLFIVRKILVEHKPVLIGTQPAATKFHLGPLYFYLTSLFAFFFKMDPRGLGIIAALLGIISIPSIFFVTKKLFNKKAAIIASCLYASSFMVVIYNKIYWPLTFAPLLTLIVYYSLLKIVAEKKFKWFIVLSLALIVGLQSEASTVSLLFLTLAILIISGIPFLKIIKNKFFLLAVFLLIFSHTSLIIFDLRHNFQNSRALIELVGKLKSDPKGNETDYNRPLSVMPLMVQTFSRLLITRGPYDLAQQISHCPVYENQKRNSLLFPVLFVAISSLVFLIYQFLKTKSLGTTIVTIHLGIVLIGLFILILLFPYYLHEWLLYLVFPSFLLTFSYFLASFSLKIPSFLTSFIVFFLVSINAYFVFTGTNSFGYKQKLQAVKYALEYLGERPFSLDSIGECFAWGGYHYIFWLEGKLPVTSYMDRAFSGYVYPTSWAGKENANLFVVIVDHDFFPSGRNENKKYKAFLKKYQEYKKMSIASETFNRTEVLIIDNENQWVRFD